MKSLLIIEDSEEIGKLWVRLARKCLYLIVHRAATIKEARELLRKKSYTNIIADINMPAGKATDMLAEEVEYIRHAEVIIVSAAHQTTRDNEGTMLKGKGLNVTHCLSKPVDAKRMREILC